MGGGAGLLKMAGGKVDGKMMLMAGYVKLLLIARAVGWPSVAVGIS